MIIVEEIKINDITYQYTHSDAGMKIKRDEVLYDEAVDPINSKREYIETNIKIEEESQL